MMTWGDWVGTPAEEEFDDGESADLAQHVRACTRRYRTLDRKITLAVYLVAAMIVLELLGVRGALSLFGHAVP